MSKKTSSCTAAVQHLQVSLTETVGIEKDSELICIILYVHRKKWMLELLKFSSNFEKEMLKLTDCGEN